MTKPKSESIKEIADYLEVKYKIGLLWKNFTREKRSDEWYKENTPTTSPFVNDGREHTMTDFTLLDLEQKNELQSDWNV